MKKLIHTLLILVAFFGAGQAFAQVDTTYRTREPFISLDDEKKDLVRHENMDEATFMGYYKWLHSNHEHDKAAFNDSWTLSCPSCPTITNYCSSFQLNQGNGSTTDPKTIVFNKGFRTFTGTTAGPSGDNISEGHNFNTNLKVFDGSKKHGLYTTGVSPANDPLASGIPIIPPGGSYSIKIGNNATQYGREGIALKITVNSSNVNFAYQYAWVFQSDHDPSSQPYMKVRIFNSSGTMLSSCDNFLYTAAKSPNVTYQTWTRNFINLTPYVGQTIYLYFETADCTASGHWGYGYFNFECRAPVTPAHQDVCVGEEFLLDQTAFSNFTPGTYTSTLTVSPSVSYTTRVDGNNTYYKITTAGTYTFTYHITKGSCTYHYDQTVTVGCDITFPSTGCINQPIELKIPSSGGFTYAVTPQDAHARYTLNGKEYIEYCLPGIKTIKIKVYNSKGQFVTELTKTINVQDCDGFYGTLSFPDTVCYKSTVALKYSFLDNLDPARFSYTWTLPADATRSGTVPNEIATFHGVGTRTIKLDIVNNRTGCKISLSDKIFVKDCKGELVCCPSSFAPGTGSYFFSGWINFNAALPLAQQPYYEVVVKYQNDQQTTYKIKPNTDYDVEGWSLASGNVSIGNFVLDLTVNMVNPSGAAAYFDDIRMQPFNSSMKGYVFDNITKRMIAELDENNYATFYEYDEEGNLIRIKKETERGVMTIQESNQNTIKK